MLIFVLHSTCWLEVKMYFSVITVVTALLPASFLLICANVSSHSYAKHLCLFDLVTLVMLLAGDYFLLQICNAAGNPPAVTMVRVKFHCLLSAVNTANCAAASRAGGQPPLDPARAVKIHGRGSGPTQTQLKSTQWREVQSLYNWCDNIPSEETHAEEQKRKSHESHKRFTAGPSLADGCLSGSKGHPQETVALSGSREGQESLQ